MVSRISSISSIFPPKNGKKHDGNDRNLNIYMLENLDSWVTAVSGAGFVRNIDFRCVSVVVPVTHVFV